MGNRPITVNVEVPLSLDYKENSQPDRKDKSVDGKKKLTEEEIKTRKEKIFKDLKKATDKIKEIQDLRTKNGDWNRDLLKSLSVFIETYFSIKNIDPFQYDRIRNYLYEAGQHLSKSKSTSVICKVIMEGLKICYIKKEGKMDTHQFDVISKSLLTLMNYSECTPEVTRDIAGEPKFLETMKETLTRIHGDHMLDEAKAEDEAIMKWCLTIYHNTSIVNDNITHLRDLDIVHDFSSFLDAKVDIYRLTALSTLANIIDEKESIEILQEKPDIIAFLVKKLGLAVKAPDHSHLEWSAQKCARAVHRLARNDTNKKLLVQKGCLPHLVKLAKIGNVEEQREAVGAIHILAKKKENHSKILDDAELKIIDLLTEMKEKSSDEQVRMAAADTLCILQEELKKIKYKHTVSSTGQEKSSVPVEYGKGHIMISYNWNHQEQLMKIRDRLNEHGFSVWMDIEKMAGSTVAAMAKAVEDAHVILMCMSKKYKDSTNCKAEAEYAFTKKKIIIPLRMESGYNPDGWLGFILGKKTVFDFSEEDHFEEKTKELIHEIDNCYKDEHAEP